MQRFAAVADLVVSIEADIMSSYVVDALATQPTLVARMAERRARIFLFEPSDGYDDAIEIDLTVQRALAAIDIGDTQLPIFIAVIGLYRLRGRYGNHRRPLDVRPYELFGVIGLGEGGAMFLDGDMRASSSTAALERLRVFVG